MDHREQYKPTIPIAVQIIVPVSSTQLPFLEDTLKLLQENTPCGHVVNVAIGNAHLESRIGEIVATARSVYDRSGIVITTCDPALGYNGVVEQALLESDFPFTAVLPANYRLVDREWFGKMQQPLVKSPMCGMTVATEEPPSTRSSCPLPRGAKVQSQFIMLSRNALSTARKAMIDLDGDDIADAIRIALLSVGATVWVVPSCRVLQTEGSWS